MLIKRIHVEKVIKLSPKWVTLFEFVHKHPYVTFSKLKFDNGEPDFALNELKIEESIKF